MACKTKPSLRKGSLLIERNRVHRPRGSPSSLSNSPINYRSIEPRIFDRGECAKLSRWMHGPVEDTTDYFVYTHTSLLLFHRFINLPNRLSIFPLQWIIRTQRYCWDIWAIFRGFCFVAGATARLFLPRGGR